MIKKKQGLETATTRRICYCRCLLHTTHTTSAPSESARDQANSTDFPCPGTALAWVLCHVTLQIHVILSILSVHPVCPVQSWTEMTRMVFWIRLSGMYQMCFHEASRLEIRWHVQEFKGYSERRAGEPFPHDPVETGDHGQPQTNSPCSLCSREPGLFLCYLVPSLINAWCAPFITDVECAPRSHKAMK